MTTFQCQSAFVNLRLKRGVFRVVLNSMVNMFYLYNKICSFIVATVATENATVPFQFKPRTRS